MKIKYLLIIATMLQASSVLTMTRLGKMSYSGQQANPMRAWWQKRYFSTTPTIRHEKKEAPIKPNVSSAGMNTSQETGYGFFAALKRWLWGETNVSADESVPVNESKTVSQKKLDSDLYWLVDSLIKETLQKIEIGKAFEGLDVKTISENIRKISQMYDLGARLNEYNIESLRRNLKTFEQQELRWIGGKTVRLRYLKCIANCYKVYSDLGIVNATDKGVVNVSKAIRFAQFNMDNLLNDFKLDSIRSKDRIFLDKMSTKNLDPSEISKLVEQYSTLYKLNFLNSSRNDSVNGLFDEIKEDVATGWGVVVEDIDMLIELALQTDRNMLLREIDGHSLLFFVFERMFNILWKNWLEREKNSLTEVISQLVGAGCYLNANDKNVLRKYVSEIGRYNKEGLYVEYPGLIKIKELLKVAHFYRLLLKLGVVDAEDNSIVNVKKCIDFSEADIDNSLLNERVENIKAKDKKLYEDALFINSLREAIEKKKKPIGDSDKAKSISLQLMEYKKANGLRNDIKREIGGESAEERYRKQTVKE